MGLSYARAGSPEVGHQQRYRWQMPWWGPATSLGQKKMHRGKQFPCSFVLFGWVSTEHGWPSLTISVGWGPMKKSVPFPSAATGHRRFCLLPAMGLSDCRTQQEAMRWLLPSFWGGECSSLNVAWRWRPQQRADISSSSSPTHPFCRLPWEKEGTVKNSELWNPDLLDKRLSFSPFGVTARKCLFLS